MSQVEYIRNRVPETEHLTNDQMNAAADRATAKIQELQEMDPIDREEELIRMCIEMEYLREVKDFQKDIIQKRGKNA